MKKILFVVGILLLAQIVYGADFDYGILPPDGVYEVIEGTMVSEDGRRCTTVMSTLAINSEKHLVVIIAGALSYGTLDPRDTTYMSGYFDDSHVEFYMGNIFMKFTYLQEEGVYRMYFSRINSEDTVMVDYIRVSD